MISFVKMHGIGNDYIFIDQIQNEQDLDFTKLANKLSKRNYGVGSDGIIVLKACRYADAKMIIYNSDGSVAKMCGNASRCAALYLAKKLNKKNITLQVVGQILDCEILWVKSKVAKVQVVLKSPKIIKKINRQIQNKKYLMHLVDVGNLHAVIFVEDFNFNIAEVGEIINRLKDFKDGINVEFVKIISNDTIQIKVYERGSGITKACGSGACASAFVFNKIINQNQKNIQVALDGGKLEIKINKDKIIMIGNAEFVYKGEY